MQYLNNLSSSLEDKFAKNFTNDHSKFIHCSWLLKEDLGRKTTLDGIEWTIVGEWNQVNLHRMILLRSPQSGYAIEDSAEVSKGMGYTSMRNFVSGLEHKGWNFGKGVNVDRLIKIDNPVKINSDDEAPETEVAIEEETSEVWKHIDAQDTQEGEDEGYIDPLIKALQDDISGDE